MTKTLVSIKKQNTSPLKFLILEEIFRKIMNRKIIETEDGSKTIYLPDWNESYHSVYGAIQEAKHVFLKSGFEKLEGDNFSILEIGFGTGLNAILTLIENQNRRKRIHYTGVEAFPISEGELQSLSYNQLGGILPYANEFHLIHQSEWGKEITINSHFTLLKKMQKIEDFIPKKKQYNLVYFDAFSPSVQPEMWTYEVLQKIYESLVLNGIFVTYCAQGEVRRNLIKLGFEVERIPGPPGKREMLRGRKK